MKSFGICSIATNGYEKYLIDCIDSFKKVNSHEYLINWYIFSDVSTNLSQRITRVDGVVFHFFDIPPYGWPDATLMRYHIYHERINDLKSDFLMHLDADMLFLPDFRFPKIEDHPELMHFVKHPGFAKINWNFYRPIETLKIIWRLVIFGGYGSWEKRKKSKAFLPRSMRKSYYCGGIWFGGKRAFGRFIVESKEAVANDLARNLIASWHDESHLNRFAAFNKIRVLGPHYCFDGKVDLGTRLPYVLAVEK